MAASAQGNLLGWVAGRGLRQGSPCLGLAHAPEVCAQHVDALENPSLLDGSVAKDRPEQGYRQRGQAYER